MMSIKDLQLKNPWWINNDYVIPEKDWPKRDIFSHLEKNLNHPLMLNIIGLRRVGKSTIVKQLIAGLLSCGIKSTNLFYYLFDYSSQIKTTEFLNNVLAVYLSEVRQKTINNLDETLYIFLDEIQYIEDWQSIVKKYYDLSNKKIKFILTGSQSILLKGKSKESLAGRIFDYYLPPLSFTEFLKINKIGFGNLVKFDLFDLPKTYFGLSGYNLTYGKKVYDISKEYIINGQFPEIRTLNSDENKSEYILESVLGKILEDCIKIYKIEKKDEFKLVAYQLLNNISSTFELKNIAREIGISSLTIEKYLGYLKESFVFEILFKYHKSLIERGRILKKVYTTCINFNCAFNHYKESHIDEVPDVFGKIIENLIYNILNQKYPRPNISFWRNGGKEIDFIVLEDKHLTDKNILPIEVKITKYIDNKDLKIITEYIQSKKIGYGIVITKNELAKKQIYDRTLYFIPYYLMLFLT
ncbi:MAG: ATP-binding protein [bacterium]